MSTIPDRAGPNAVPNAVPNPVAATTPAPSREKQRWFSLRGGGRANQFSLSLKSNARWMKSFLHGDK